MRKLCVALIAFSSLYAADPHFSGTERQRHEEMRAYFEKEDHHLPPRKYITGNWGGARADLARRGITFSSTYANDTVGNPVGGRSRGVTTTGSWGADLKVDFDRSLGWRGTTFYTSVAWRRGSSLTAEKIDNQFPVQQVFGTQTFQLDCFYFSFKTPEESATLKLGRINGGDYFFQSDLYYMFVNNAFCGNPIAIFFNIPFTAYPHATWGAYSKLKYKNIFDTKWAVFFNNTDVNLSKWHGCNFKYNSTEKLTYITEWSFRVNQNEEHTGLPGNYRAGLYYASGKSDQNFPTGKEGKYGYYFLIDQMIYRFRDGREKGITPFFTLLLCQDKYNLLPFFFTTGIVSKGFLDARPEDAVNIGAAYGAYSNALRRRQRAHGDPQQHWELDLEFNYKAHINPWFYVQPTMMYIFNPKGFRDVQNAYVIGVQAQLTF